MKMKMKMNMNRIWIVRIILRWRYSLTHSGRQLQGDGIMDMKTLPNILPAELAIDQGQ